MPNFAALRAAVSRYLRKTSGGGADIRPPVGARVKTDRFLSTVPPQTAEVCT